MRKREITSVALINKAVHQRLRNTLAGCKGKWIISYNEFIRELYRDYAITPVTPLEQWRSGTRVAVNTRRSLLQLQSQRARKEYIPIKLI